MKALSDIRRETKLDASSNTNELLPVVFSSFQTAWPIQDHAPYAYHFGVGLKLIGFGASGLRLPE